MKIYKIVGLVALLIGVALIVTTDKPYERFGLISITLAFFALYRTMENDLEKFKEQLKNSDDKVKDLTNQCGELKATHDRKIDIDTLLMEAANSIRATACSLLVPISVFQDSSNKDRLAFLCLHGDASAKLINLRISLKDRNTIVSRVFHDQRPDFTFTKEKFSTEIAQAIEYPTQGLLTVPLIHLGKAIGVVQFLNKTIHNSIQSFEQQDLSLIDDYLKRIVSILNLIQDKKSLRLLGVLSDIKEMEATILFSDLSQSSFLFEDFNSEDLALVLKDYFESLCEVGVKYGGVIENFLGDGFIVTFNASIGLDDHKMKAIQAAIEMQQQFSEWKTKWSQFSPGFNRIYNRIAIDSGSVVNIDVCAAYRIPVRTYGISVCTAGVLCELAPRDKNIIIIGDSLSEQPNEMGISTERVTEIDFSNIEKAVRYNIRKAWILN